MSQLRRHSLLESCLNTASGFLVSCLAWPLVCRWVLHEPFRAGPGLGVVAVFTVLSIARNYLWRRAFNRKGPTGYKRSWLTPEEAREMMGLIRARRTIPPEDCQ